MKIAVPAGPQFPTLGQLWLAITPIWGTGLQGKVYMHACGVMAADDNEIHTVMVILDATDTQFCTTSIRYHLCFVCPEELDTVSLEQWLRTKNMPAPERRTLVVSDPEESPCGHKTTTLLAGGV